MATGVAVMMGAVIAATAAVSNRMASTTLEWRLVGVSAARGGGGGAAASSVHE